GFPPFTPRPSAANAPGRRRGGPAALRGARDAGDPHPAAVDDGAAHAAPGDPVEGKPRGQVHRALPYRRRDRQRSQERRFHPARPDAPSRPASEQLPGAGLLFRLLPEAHRGREDLPRSRCGARPFGKRMPDRRVPQADARPRAL
ncbi:MAG: hypothetical protein AVDCRST_MAG91-3669, partial [uncultured Sphingomonadaceae bacterium]